MQITINAEKFERNVVSDLRKMFFGGTHTAARISGYTKALATITGLPEDEVVRHYGYKSIPADFEISQIPKEWWLGKNQELNPRITRQMVNFMDLYTSLPKEEMEKEGVLENLVGCYLMETRMFHHYWKHCQDPRLVMEKFRTSGTQHIAEFSLFDRGKPNDPNSINWHGQNTSQWAYAGCFLVQDGRVSTHH